MDKSELERMMNLAGLTLVEANDLDEKAKPDFADIDNDGDKEEDMADAAKDKKQAKNESAEISVQMREWSNSIYQRYEDRGNVTTQPEGEVVDNSLRRYLDADPMKVQIDEDWNPAKMVDEYKKYKDK
jgi:hypothetical protein